MKGFKALSTEQIIGVLRDRAADFDDNGTEDTIKSKLQRDLELGHAVLVVEEDCIAVVRPERWKPGRTNSLLWLLLVHPDKRGRGVGEKMVLRLVQAFSREYPMELLCNGKRRIAYFERCGFKVVKDAGGGSILMQSNI